MINWMIHYYDGDSSRRFFLSTVTFVLMRAMTVARAVLFGVVAVVTALPALHGRGARDLVEDGDADGDGLLDLGEFRGRVMEARSIVEGSKGQGEAEAECEDDGGPDDDEDLLDRGLSELALAVRTMHESPIT